MAKGASQPPLLEEEETATATAASAASPAEVATDAAAALSEAPTAGSMLKSVKRSERWRGRAAVETEEARRAVVVVGFLEAGERGGGSRGESVSRRGEVEETETREFSSSAARVRVGANGREGRKKKEFWSPFPDLFAFFRHRGTRFLGAVQQSDQKLWTASPPSVRDRARSYRRNLKHAPFIGDDARRLLWRRPTDACCAAAIGARARRTGRAGLEAAAATDEVLLRVLRDREGTGSREKA